MIFKSVFSKLVACMLGLTIISIAVVGFFLINDLESVQKRNATNEVQKAIESFCGNIGNMLEEKIRVGDMLSRTPWIISGDMARTAETLAAVQKSDTIYESVWVANKDGFLTTIQPYNEKLIGVNFSDRKYFQDAIKEKKAVISEVIISRNTNLPIVMVATPIFDNGIFAGIVGQTISLAKVEQIRSKVKIGETGYLGVSTNSGGKSICIAHPNKELVAKQVDVAEKLDIIKQSLTGRPQVMSFDSLAGVRMLGVSGFVPMSNWIVVGMVPEKEIFAEVQQSKVKVYGLIGILIVVVLILTWILARNFTKPLVQMGYQVNEAAKGNLRDTNVVATTQDEVGRLGMAYNTMMDGLRGIIVQVRQSSDELAASSEQLRGTVDQTVATADKVAEAINTVAQGAAEQLRSIDKTTEIVENMSASIQQIAATAGTVTETSDKAASAAAQGGKAIEEAVRQMNIIESKVNNSAEVVQKLGERSKDIVQIVNAISGIAGQTNLLALNAAIEAARAGEQGRGFAVVAEEVRKLAEQAQDAAKQIEVMIDQIRVDTQNAVEAMLDGTGEVRNGTAAVSHAGMVFNNISSLSGHTSEQVREITTAIHTLADGSQNIVEAVRSIHKISEQTSSETHGVSVSLAEQISSIQAIAVASQNLARMSGEMQKAVNRFIV